MAKSAAKSSLFAPGKSAFSRRIFGPYPLGREAAISQIDPAYCRVFSPNNAARLARQKTDAQSGPSATEIQRPRKMNQQTPDAFRLFALNDDHRSIREMASDFAQGELAPQALEWDEKKHFPVDVIREAAALGMGGDLRARGRRRLRADAARRGADLRGAGDRLPRGRRLHLHPQHVRLDDRPLRRRGAARKIPAAARHDGAAGELLPHRARRRLRRRGAAHPRRPRRRSLCAERRRSNSSPAPATSTISMS